MALQRSTGRLLLKEHFRIAFQRTFYFNKTADMCHLLNFLVEIFLSTFSCVLFCMVIKAILIPSVQMLLRNLRKKYFFLENTPLPQTNAKRQI